MNSHCKSCECVPRPPSDSPYNKYAEPNTLGEHYILHVDFNQIVVTSGFCENVQGMSFTRAQKHGFTGCY